jgi:hypothetical protein
MKHQFSAKERETHSNDDGSGAPDKNIPYSDMKYPIIKKGNEIL